METNDRKEKAVEPNGFKQEKFNSLNQSIDKVFGVSVKIVALTAVIAILLIFFFVFWEAKGVFFDPKVWEEASIGKLFAPQNFKGYSEPTLVWQPNSDNPKFSVLPLILGSIKATIIAILFAAPLAIAAAVYSAQFAGLWVREFVKPAIELLAGIPSVVLGFFTLIVMATLFQDAFHLKFRLNGFTAGIALGIAIIPIIFTLSEDAIRTVPKSYIEASLSLGASYSQTTWRVTLPAAIPGIFAAVTLGFGRAIGETMIVWMASGNGWEKSADPFVTLRTIAATIAAEMGEVVQGDTHYTVLFFLGFMLFVFTFILNFIGDIVVHRFKRKISGLK